MSIEIGTLRNDFSMMLLTPEESELFLNLYENSPSLIEHVGGVVFYYKPAELMVSLDRKIYNEFFSG